MIVFVEHVYLLVVFDLQTRRVSFERMDSLHQYYMRPFTVG